MILKILMINLKNKKILITGATGGIGGSLVDKFDKLGAKIIATGTNDEKLNNLKNNFSNIIVEKFKLDDHDKIDQFVEKIDNNINGLDILVNNAGLLWTIFLFDYQKKLKKVLDINLTSTFLM